ncbi:MAG: HAD-IA family hydrolase [Verrucomicrobiales bacterium]|jgi:HAD superfamily hydrolase (TIGR01509 family)|nr:HAD-IA family hydrolase [Verrucomicrobiales bacterium]
MDALLFDFDGLILDTEVPVFEAWQANYQAHGHDLPLETYIQCVGSDFARFDPKMHLESLTGDSIDWTEWDQRRESEALAKVEALAPMPGVVELLDEAKRSGLPCAVASSSPRSWVERHLDRLGLLGSFELTRCLDDVEQPKPSPELFLAAAAGLGVAPEKAVVFEDSLNGLKAAQAAGSPCVVVPNQVTRLLEFPGATRIVPSLSRVNVEDLRTLFAS